MRATLSEVLLAVGFCFQTSYMSMLGVRYYMDLCARIDRTITVFFIGTPV